MSMHATLITMRRSKHFHSLPLTAIIPIVLRDATVMANWNTNYESEDATAGLTSRPFQRCMGPFAADEMI